MGATSAPSPSPPPTSPPPTGTPPASTEPPAAPPSTTVPPVVPGLTIPGVIVRAEKITVDTLVARVVYAEKIEAEELAVADLRQEQDPARWANEIASHQLTMAHLEADTIYAKEIRAGLLTATQVFAKKAEVKPGNGKSSGSKEGGMPPSDDDAEGDD
jgi:hypothetical protein